MYATCIFCNGPLGTNAVLEEFPVGRRLAFDAGKGRLWVVCRKCERWNLSPIEERWEAIEAAERLFRDTRMRVSTEQIGLARHAEGLELVRIGSPQRPEFAAWRYGDQFGRRRRRAFLVGGASVAVVGTILIAGAATGVLSGAVVAQSGNLTSLWQNRRTRVRVRLADGELLKLRRPDLMKARLRPADESGGVQLVVGKGADERVFTGAEAERLVGRMMTRVNAAGGSAAAVQTAVRELEAAGGPDAYLDRLVTHGPTSRRPLRFGDGPVVQLGNLPTPTRLALEMALHEEQERRALEGELRGLTLAWQEAEEIAAIADDLLLPGRIRQFLSGERRPGASSARG